MKELLNKIAAWLKQLWQKVKDWIYTDLDPDIDPDTMCQVEDLKAGSVAPAISDEAKNLGFYPIMLTLRNISPNKVDLICETKLVPASDSLKTEMTFTLDISSMNQSNIFKVGVKGMDDIRGILHGPRDPYTGKQSFDTMSWDEDSADFTKMSTLGVCILDPMRTMSIIPNILRGV